jgi:tRNA(Ile)-lysidine synthase
LRAEVLPLLEDVLAGGVAPALARTAAQLRDDCDTLDALAADLLAALTPGGPQAGLDATALGRAPSAIRRRVIRSWLLAGGVPELTDAQLRAVDALVDPDRWHGQGAVALPGQFEAGRAGGRLLLDPRPT